MSVYYGQSYAVDTLPPLGCRANKVDLVALRQEAEEMLTKQMLPRNNQEDTENDTREGYAHFDLQSLLDSPRSKLGKLKKSQHNTGGTVADQDPRHELSQEDIVQQTRLMAQKHTRNDYPIDLEPLQDLELLDLNDHQKPPRKARFNMIEDRYGTTRKTIVASKATIDRLSNPILSHSATLEALSPRSRKRREAMETKIGLLDREKDRTDPLLTQPPQQTKSFKTMKKPARGQHEQNHRGKDQSIDPLLRKTNVVKPLKTGKRNLGKSQLSVTSQETISSLQTIVEGEAAMKKSRSKPIESNNSTFLTQFEDVTASTSIPESRFPSSTRGMKRQVRKSSSTSNLTPAVPYARKTFHTSTKKKEEVSKPRSLVEPRLATFKSNARTRPERQLQKSTSDSNLNITTHNRKAALRSGNLQAKSLAQPVASSRRKQETPSKVQQTLPRHQTLRKSHSTTSSIESQSKRKATKISTDPTAQVFRRHRSIDKLQTPSVVPASSPSKRVVDSTMKQRTVGLSSTSTRRACNHRTILEPTIPLRHDQPDEKSTSRLWK